MNLTQKRLKEVLDYNPSTGSFTRRNSKRKPSDARKYKKFYIDGKQYLAHRLAWLYVFGVMPVNCIDHINCDPSDNRICNLRIATYSENLANQKIHRNNKVGLKGVIASRQRFRARINKDGMRRNIGVFDTADEAHAAYVNAAQELFGSFARAA